MKFWVDVPSVIEYIWSKLLAKLSKELLSAIALGPVDDLCNCRYIELIVIIYPGLGVTVKVIKSSPDTASSIEVNAQLVALNRPPLAEAVSPAPLEMVEVERFSSLYFELAVSSFPAKAENSKLKICPHPWELNNNSKSKPGNKRRSPLGKSVVFFICVILVVCIES
ncbi:MAG: hypothetical protein AB7E36_02400 [Salinivirgaceae bacterium]